MGSIFILSVLLMLLLSQEVASFGSFGSLNRRVQQFQSAGSVTAVTSRVSRNIGGVTQERTCMVLKASKEEKAQMVEVQEAEESAFDKVASMGLAGVLAIGVAESIFWALGVPLAMIYYKYTTGDWIDVMTTDGQLKAAGFSFGYGGFATVILQYRVTLFAIPLVPIMDKYAVKPLKKAFGESFGEKNLEEDN